MRRLPALAVAATFVVAPLAACGGDDGGDTLTEDEWLEQADAVCAEANDDLDSVFDDLDENSTPEDFADVILEDSVPRIQEQIDDLRDLNPPDEIADDVEELLDTAQDALDELEEAAGDDPEELFNAENDPFQEVTDMAADLGLDDCAE